MKFTRTSKGEVEDGTKMHSLQGTQQERQIKTSLYPGGLAGWLFRRLRRADTNRQAVIKQMRLLETLPLGGKRNLMLISCSGELFLVGGNLEGIESIVRVHGETRSVATKKRDGLCL